LILSRIPITCGHTQSCTGSDHFNRSMRLWAKKLGWTLSDKGLMPAFRMSKRSDSSTEYKYQNEKVWTGDSLVCHTEEEIFQALGLVYVDPPYRTSDPNAMKIGDLVGATKGVGETGGCIEDSTGGSSSSSSSSSGKGFRRRLSRKALKH
jgi:hypothetical protein